MQLTGVFVVEREIPEIGARPGDRLVIRPGRSAHPYCLIRPLSHAESRWAFRSDHCTFEFSKPPLPPRSQGGRGTPFRLQYHTN